MKNLFKRNHLWLILLLWQVLNNGCSQKSVSPTATKTPPPANLPPGTFVNPIANGADPWVIKKDSFYYFCASREGGIHISRSKKLTQPGTSNRVWSAPASGWNRTNIWAPELHYLNGKWYIYYAAGEAGPPFIHQRAGVLESATEDPMGEYLDKGMLYTGDNMAVPASSKWAIDLTAFTMNGQLYAVWSGWEDNASTDKTPQHLYIATMSNPWIISSNRMKISSPEQPWETGTQLQLNEGPELLKNGGKAFIIYSCNESWLPAYKLGQLTLPDTLMNPMEPANWQKKGPVFQGTERVYGVGHASFTLSPDSTENWIFYHSKKTIAPGWNRDVRLQKFTWHTDGSPDFGVPVPAGEPIALPSGEK